MDTPSPAAFPDPIPGILPFGTVSIFSAASGAGKTSMIAEWCARFHDGRPIWGHPTCRPTAICYIAADRAWRADHALWFAAAGCPPIHHYSLADDPNVPHLAFRPDGAASLFEHVLAALLPPPGALVILDPLTPLFISGSANDQRPVALTLLRLGRACQQHQLTMLATAYFGKQKQDSASQYIRPVDRIAGSGVFAGYSHTQMYLVESPNLIEQPFHTFGWKPRHAPEEEFQIVRDRRTGLFVPYEGLVEDGADAEHDRPTQLLLLIPPEGLESGTLESVAIEHFGYSRATFYRDIAILLDRKLLQRTRHGFFIPRQPS